MADGSQMRDQDPRAPDPGDLDGAEARYRAIVDTAIDAILVVDEMGGIVSFNPAAERLFGYDAGEVIGRNLRLLVPERNRAVHDATLARYRAEGVRRTAGVTPRAEGLCKDGRVVPLSFTVAEWRSRGQRFFTGILRDISEQIRAEDLQQLLLGELNHRVKNSFAAMQTVISQTLRNATDLTSAREALNGRLLAMAKGHDILTRRNWEGASLEDIIAETIEAHGRPECFTVTGPHACLTPKVALAMSMTFYELCTNAEKYGALSVDGGHVDIAISNVAGQIRIVWRETGGPRVAPPTRRGFGSRMIGALAHDLDGEARLDFHPEGLVCAIVAKARNREPPLSA